MNAQVQRYGHPRDCSVTDELCIAEKSGCAMVIGMEEGQRLLFEDEEDGIDQFEVFGQVVHLEDLSVLCL